LPQCRQRIFRRNTCEHVTKGPLFCRHWARWLIRSNSRAKRNLSLTATRNRSSTRRHFRAGQLSSSAASFARVDLYFVGRTEAKRPRSEPDRTRGAARVLTNSHPTIFQRGISAGAEASVQFRITPLQIRANSPVSSANSGNREHFGNARRHSDSIWMECVLL